MLLSQDWISHNSVTVVANMTMATRNEILKSHLESWLTAKNDRPQRAELTKNICFATGMHPKSVPRAFRRVQMQQSTGRRAGRPVVFGPDVTAALYDIWEAANYPCGELLYPVIAEYVAIFRRDGQWAHRDETAAQLLAAKEHTIRRRIVGLRKKHRGDRGMGGTKPSALKSIIPIFKGPWTKFPPGHGQLDTVAHCGNSLVGDFIWSVNYTDFATYWIVTRAQWNKGQIATVENLEAIRTRLPFPWIMGHPDTGSEFINWIAKAWFDTHGIAFTRSEPGKKNDNMCVEERNGHVIRKYLGYQRLDVCEAVDLVNTLYDVLNVYLNHFIAVRRTRTKERVGAKYRRTYEKAQTPYARVLAHASVTETVKTQLRHLHETLNPKTLHQEIVTLQTALLKLHSRNHGTEIHTPSQ